MSSERMMSHDAVVRILRKARQCDWGFRRTEEEICTLIMACWPDGHEEVKVELSIDEPAARILHGGSEIIHVTSADLGPPEPSTSGPGALFHYELVELLHRATQEDWSPQRLSRQVQNLVLLRWGPKSMRGARIGVSMDDPKFRLVVGNAGHVYVRFDLGSEQSVHLTPLTIDITAEDLASVLLGPSKS